MSLEREQLVSYGMAQLGREGLSVDLSQFRVDVAAVACGIDPVAARQIWEGPDDEADAAFGRAVLHGILGRQLSDAVDQSVVTSMVEVITRSLDQAAARDDLSVDERRALIQDLCRSASAVALDLPKTSPSWRAFVVVSTLIFAHPDANEWLVDAWDENRADTTPRLTNLYSVLPGMFGMQLRYCYSWEQLLATMSAVGEGLIMRHESLGDAAMVQRATGPNGEVETWSLLAVAAEAIFQQFFEPIDPDDESPFFHEPGPAGRHH